MSLIRPAEHVRQRDRAEWLRPLEHLVGVSLRDGTDCFVGRHRELNSLVNFADVLRPRSVGEMETRLLRSAGGAHSPQAKAQALMLIAPCGLGKSALIAKFALDYALKSAVPFPFIYFDLSRVSPGPHKSLDLLRDAAWQLSLQFPDYVSSLTALANEVLDWTASPDDIRALSQNSSDDDWSRRPSELYFISFRNMLKTASLWSGRTLIVLDALDAVQGDPKAMASVKEFLRLLCGDGFPQLRLLLVGRAEAREFRGLDWLSIAERPLTLGPLSFADAHEMVNKLGGFLLQENWQPTWASKIVRRGRASPCRRDPLSLRTGVEFLCSVSKEYRDQVVCAYGGSNTGGHPREGQPRER